MKIVFQANQELPVKTYGGTERIIFWLMKHLKELGHKPVLIGNPNSKVHEFGIELIPYDPNGEIDWEMLIPKDADIVHLSYNYEFKQSEVPCLFTVHGNGQIGETFSRNSVFVSHKHAQNHGSESFVYNGIDFDEYPATQIKKENAWNDFLFLAKASWRIKNLRSCLRSCKKTKKNLHIAGGKSWLPSRYVINHGFVGGKKKNEIIQSCDALLFPVKWEEPFGLAIIEAMGFGLPILGSPYGSLPELITSDTGIICQNETEMINHLRNAPGVFKPQQIIDYARENFSSIQMAKSYLKTYERILNKEIINTAMPTWQFKSRATSALPF